MSLKMSILLMIYMVILTVCGIVMLVMLEILRKN